MTITNVWIGKKYEIPFNNEVYKFKDFARSKKAR